MSFSLVSDRLEDKSTSELSITQGEYASGEARKRAGCFDEEEVRTDLRCLGRGSKRRWGTRERTVANPASVLPAHTCHPNGI